MEDQRRQAWDRRIFNSLVCVLVAFLVSRFLGTTGWMVLLGLGLVGCGVYAGLRERRESKN